MIKPDDSYLDEPDLRFVEARAHNLLERAGALGRFPTNIDEMVAAANLRIAPVSLFDPASIVAFLRNKGHDVTRWLKSAVSKVFGVYDGFENFIHVDDTLGRPKKNFVTLHETGHHELPVHRKLFRLFQDCDKNLEPDVADQLEREANNFARYALFQGDAFKQMAADSALEIKTPMGMAPKFGLRFMRLRASM